jgi:hypothetical protein
MRLPQTRIAVIEIRRSPLRWWFPVLVVIDLAALFGRSRWWVGEWPQASAAAQIPAFYLGPVAAIGAAWSAARRDIRTQVAGAARPRWRIEAVQLLGALFWVTAAYSVGIAVAQVASSVEVGRGVLWPSYLLLGMVVVVSCAAFGHLVGSWWPSVLAAPLATGLVCFLALLLYGGRAGLVLVVGEPFVSLSWGALATRCVLSIAVIVAAIFAARPNLNVHRWRKRSFAVGASATALVLTVTGAAFSAAPSTTKLRPMPKHSVCTTGEPKVCLWPEDRKYLPEFQAMAARIGSLPTGLFASPEAFYEQGLQKPTIYNTDGSPVPGGDIYILEGSTWDAALSMSGRILETTLKNCVTSSPADTKRLGAAYGELLIWLSTRITGAGRPKHIHGGPVDEASADEISRLIDWPEHQQVSWVKERFDTIKSIPCE